VFAGNITKAARLYNL